MADDAKSLFQKGVAAIRDQHDAAAGRQFLLQSLKLEPRNDAAWVWMSQTISDPQKKLECLKRALQINPANPQALSMRQKLERGSPAPDKAQIGSPPSAGVDSADMGSLLGSSLTTRWLLVVKIASLVISIVIAIAMVAALLILNHYFPAGTGLPFNQLFGVILVLALVGVGFFIYALIKPSNVLIEIYERGIRRTQRGARQTWRWEAFTTVRVADRVVIHTYYGIPFFREHEYVCRVLIDQKVVLKINKDFQNYKEIGTLIAAKATPVFFERDVKRYKVGENLRYGTIEVNHEGIRDVWKFWKLALWSDVESFAVDGPWLRVKRFERGEAYFYLVDLPNAFVFLKMVEMLTPKTHV